jgi:hypothetical protein
VRKMASASWRIFTDVSEESFSPYSCFLMMETGQLGTFLTLY